MVKIYLITWTILTLESWFLMMGVTAQTTPSAFLRQESEAHPVQEDNIFYRQHDWPLREVSPQPREEGRQYMTAKPQHKTGNWTSSTTSIINVTTTQFSEESRSLSAALVNGTRTSSTSTRPLTIPSSSLENKFAHHFEWLNGSGSSLMGENQFGAAIASLEFEDSNATKPRWRVRNMASMVPQEFLVADSEAPIVSPWIKGGWPAETIVSEEVIQDEISGCICRLKLNERITTKPHLVCYGATTCLSFPRKLILPGDLLDFRIKTTGIVNLRHGDLEHFDQLHYLEIDANSYFTYIEPHVFLNMSRLLNLSISFNGNLRFLHEYTFDGLTSLRGLRLIKNGFQHIAYVSPSLSVSLLPNLKSLSLAENIFKEIRRDSFYHLSKTQLKELNLQLCQIEDIDPGSLSGFENLETLKLGENLLTEEMLQKLLQNMSEHKIPLSFLTLNDMGFRNGTKLTSLLKTISELQVRHLSLRRNRIESLYEGLFPKMQYLEVLDVREVSALDIETYTLYEGLVPNLEVLLLGGNKLPGIMPGVLLHQLYELDLSGNSGGTQSRSYFDVNSNVFDNMTKLELLNLSYNSIVTISNTTFDGVSNLRVLGLKNATIYYIAENSFSMLKNLQLLNLENNPFQPFNTFQDSIFDGLENLEVLLLSECKITHFVQLDIFKPLTKLKYLSLRGNELAEISPAVFQELPSLKGLDLSSNQLGPWENRLFQSNPNLTLVILSNNLFTHLSWSMMEDLSPIKCIAVISNPFVCDCAFFHQIQFWLAKNQSIGIYSLMSSVCVSPDEWKDKQVGHFVSVGGVNCDVGRNSQTFYILITLFSAITIVLGILSYMYRWYIRYWIFLTKVAYIRRQGWFKRKHNVYHVYKYDAFVSYSHEDRNFIIRLVSMLENYEPHLKLCVYERDFEIGTVISDTVMEKVAASRRTLLIVSDAFARSQWCMWELQLAEYHRLFFKPDESNGHCDDSLIIIRLGPVAHSHMTPMLKYLLKTRIYLEWNSEQKKQKVFWQKLRNSLAPACQENTSPKPLAELITPD